MWEASREVASRCEVMAVDTSLRSSSTPWPDGGSVTPFLVRDPRDGDEEAVPPLRLVTGLDVLQAGHGL